MEDKNNSRGSKALSGCDWLWVDRTIDQARTVEGKGSRFREILYSGAEDCGGHQVDTCNRQMGRYFCSSKKKSRPETSIWEGISTKVNTESIKLPRGGRVERWLMTEALGMLTGRCSGRREQGRQMAFADIAGTPRGFVVIGATWKGPKEHAHPHH